MPWLGLPFTNRDLKGSLASKYNCSGIPYLVLLDGKTGETITTEGRSAITDASPEGFPFTKEAIQKAKEDKAAKKSAAFADWKIFEDEVDVSQLKNKEAVCLFFGAKEAISGVHVYATIK